MANTSEMKTHPRINSGLKYFYQDLTLGNKYFQNWKTVLSRLLAAPSAGFRSYFFAIIGKCRRLCGVKATRFKRKAVTIQAQRRRDSSVKAMMIRRIGNAKKVTTNTTI
ncbi:MAG TPA: hypothetical protein DEQ17_05475 [Prevotella sp.]|nr:hypothetical protein [Prevotella sp.]